jgi:hypothetical protein
MNKTRLFKLNKKFQKDIFKKIIKKFGSSLKAENFFKIPASSIRGYKNLYFDSVPQEVINKFLELNILNKEELEKNTILTFLKEDQITQNLNKGRVYIRNKFLKTKGKIPKLTRVLRGNYLDFSLWFNNYLPLLNSGFRKTTVKENSPNFIVSYKNFTKGGFKSFEVILPKKFIIDKSFLYFFGLWCGDRSGGKRWGICNKNSEVISFTENFLINYGQKVERILYITKGLVEPNIVHHKKFIVDNDIRGWVLSVHSNNGILSSFFNYLYLHLEEFLQKINQPEIFFAGLFDAEGNVSLYNKSFRFACKDKKRIQIYSKFLRKLELFERYDGNCLITYNKKNFYNKIFPYLKHQKKIDLTRFLVEGSPLPQDYRGILRFIKTNPNLSSKDLAKALKKSKIYSELKLLNNFGFISAEGYPARWVITNKSLKELGEK